MSTTLATREAEGTSRTQVAQWIPSFVTSVNEAVERVNAKRDFYERVMRADVHYGRVPGSDKPALLKPGAELLLSSMGLFAELTDEVPPIKDLMGTEHGGEAFIEYRRVCRIYRQTGPTEDERVKVAQASGSCSSWEKKYRYRDDQRRCPNCNKTTIFKSRNEGEGWYCWRKKDGCGATFAEGDPRVATQMVGRSPNPDVADLDNTLLKMADKRAYVAATLLATGCSDAYTQDIEESVDHERHDAGGAKTNGAKTSTPAATAAPAADLPADTDLEKLDFFALRGLVRKVHGIPTESMTGEQTKAIAADLQSVLGSKKKSFGQFDETELREYLRRKSGASEPISTSTEGADPAGVTPGQSDAIQNLIADKGLNKQQVEILVGGSSKGRTTDWGQLLEPEADTLIVALQEFTTGAALQGELLEPAGAA